MKKAVKITSALCLFVAAASVIFGIIAFKAANRSIFMGFALFSVFKSGGIMGFIGNILIVILTAACYGLSGWYGFTKNVKNALLWSVFTTILAVLSLVVVIVSSKLSITLGDIIVTVIPIAHLFLVFNSAD